MYRTLPVAAWETPHQRHFPTSIKYTETRAPVRTGSRGFGSGNPALPPTRHSGMSDRPQAGQEQLNVSRLCSLLPTPDRRGSTSSHCWHFVTGNQNLLSGPNVSNRRVPGLIACAHGPVVDHLVPAIGIASRGGPSSRGEPLAARCGPCRDKCPARKATHVVRASW